MNEKEFYTFLFLIVFSLLILTSVYSYINESISWDKRMKEYDKFMEDLGPIVIYNETWSDDLLFNRNTEKGVEE